MKKILYYFLLLVLFVTIAVVKKPIYNFDKNNNEWIGYINNFSYGKNNTNEREETPTLDDFEVINLDKEIKISSLKNMVQKQKTFKNQLLSLSSEKSELNQIIDNIKKVDLSFNINDYKVRYVLPNDEKEDGTIMLVYYIDGLVETNKVYLVEIIDNQVKEIRLGGVLKKNIKTIDENNNDKIAELAKGFNRDTKLKTEKILNEDIAVFKSNDILNEDGTIDVNSLVDNTENYQERFLYNYNTKKLIYELSVTVEYSYGTFANQAIEIELN